MIKVKVLPGQNLTDIAIQEYGSTSGLFHLALLNNVTLGTPLTVGQELLIDETKVVANLSRFYDRKIIVATGEPPVFDNLADRIFSDEFDEEFS